MKVICKYAGRSQKALTKDKEYIVLETNSKTKRIKIKDDNGKNKWYTAERFRFLDTEPTETEHVSSEPTSEESPLAGLEEKFEESEHMTTPSFSGKISREVVDRVRTAFQVIAKNADIVAGQVKLKAEGNKEDLVTCIRIIADNLKRDAGSTYFAVSVGLEKFTTSDMQSILNSMCSKMGITPHHTTSAPVTTTDKAKEIHEEREMTKPKPKKDEPTMYMYNFLKAQGVPTSMLDAVAEWRRYYKLDASLMDRVPVPTTLFMGGETWTAAIAAILEGQHILLEGAKATGKNVLASNLAFIFGRPMWDVSFHVHTDATSLIGAETFKDNEVKFRPGAVYEVSVNGGFGILDEINMGKSEALAVMHSVLDDRRVIDVPGYDKIALHPATRFIGTMNYGYSGTRELNEALTSRFVIISVPQLDNTNLVKLLQSKFPTADNTMLHYFAGTFNDIQTKAKNAEISTKAVDIRGIISALKLIQRGVEPLKAMEVSVVNKAFDEYERNIVRDTVKTRISSSWKPSDIFKTDGSITVDFGGVK